jgi:hypothetical protein
LPAVQPPRQGAGLDLERVFDNLDGVGLVGRWWNGARDSGARRDIWLMHDGDRWHVRARHGGPGGREIRYAYDREYEARAMVDRLIATSRSVSRWKDLTKLIPRAEHR